MRKIKLAVVVILATTWLGEASFVKGQPTLDIPADSLAIPILRRIQTRMGTLLPWQDFPQVDRSVATSLNPSQVTQADSLALSMLLPIRRSQVLSWVSMDKSHSLFFQPLFNFDWKNESRLDSNDGFRRVGIGASIFGNISPRLSYFSKARIFSEYTDKAQFTHQFSPEFGETYSVEKGAGDSLLTDRTYNRYVCYVLADLPYSITLKAGKDRIRLGPGYFTSLLASSNTPPYWLMDARIDFSPWLKISDQLLRMTDTNHDILKYANIHRLEFKPVSNFVLGFSDIVIYQDRDPDLRYALPLVPLTFTESDMGGPDNTGMALDFLFASRFGVSFWGELFVDDLLGPTSFFDRYWENRWAGLVGFQVVSPIKSFDADLVVEFSRVEPWTYNGRKPQTSFRHFNVPSASQLGPDSRTWNVQLEYHPWKWLELKEHVGLYDKGQGRPGTLGVIHEDEVDGLTKEWLGSELLSYRIFEQSFGIQFHETIFFLFSWMLDVGDQRTNQLGMELRATW